MLLLPAAAKVVTVVNVILLVLCCIINCLVLPWCRVRLAMLTKPLLRVVTFVLAMLVVG